jgi:hypothetical protein
MAYKDLARQRAYQRRWVAIKRQRQRQLAGVSSPTSPAALPMTPAQAASLPPLTLTAWATQVQALPAACDAARQRLRQLEPGLMRDAIAGRCRAPVSEVQFLVTRSQTRLQQVAEALAELEACRRRLVQVVPVKQP